MFFYTSKKMKILLLVGTLLILLFVFSLTVLYPMIFRYRQDATLFSLSCNYDFDFGNYESLSFLITEDNNFIYTTVINGEKIEYKTKLSNSEVRKLHDFVIVEKRIFLRLGPFKRKKTPKLGDRYFLATSYLTIKHNNLIKTIGGYRAYSFKVYEEISKMLDSLQQKHFNLRESFP